MLLTSWLVFLIMSAQPSISFKKLFILLILILFQSLFFFTFSTINILLFYFFFEWALVPIFLIILGFGYQPERLKASIFFLFFYTLFASLPLLLIILTLTEWGQTSELRIMFTLVSTMGEDFNFFYFFNSEGGIYGKVSDIFCSPVIA